MATCSVLRKIPGDQRFNPHPSQDGKPVIVQFPRLVAFQSTSQPGWQAGIHLYINRTYRVSIHIPARMARGKYKDNEALFMRFNPHPSQDGNAKTPTTPHHLSPLSINFFNIPLSITRHLNNSQFFQPLPSIIPVRTSRLSLFTSHSHQTKHLPFQNFRKHSHYFSPA